MESEGVTGISEDTIRSGNPDNFENLTDRARDILSDISTLNMFNNLTAKQLYYRTSG